MVLLEIVFPSERRKGTIAGRHTVKQVGPFDMPRINPSKNIILSFSPKPSTTI
jgi:hypothetical protein